MEHKVRFWMVDNSMISQTFQQERITSWQSKAWSAWKGHCRHIQATTHISHAGADEHVKHHEEDNDTDVEEIKAHIHISTRSGSKHECCAVWCILKFGWPQMYVYNLFINKN